MLMSGSDSDWYIRYIRAALLAALVISASSASFAHGGKKHGGHEASAPKESSAPVESSAPTAPDAPAETDVYRTISEAYLQNVKPIYQKKCFDCHSQATTFPWYYKIPGVKQLIDHDIAEAKTHMDFSQDYPFKGHGSPSEDLVALRDVINEGSMPPVSYRLMHQGTGLTDEEKRTVLSWIEFGLSSLGKLGSKSIGSGN